MALDAEFHSGSSTELREQRFCAVISEVTWPTSLPMYCLPEMEDANAAFLVELQRRLHAKGIEPAAIDLDGEHDTVTDDFASRVLFTQMCGYPLFKYYRDQYRVLATPHYAMPGCVGGSHRAFFMVRADDPAEQLEDLRGGRFGCNSLLSNSGMNLPRLSLARIAGGRPFFSSVVMTGAHIESLAYVDQGKIDICSIDNVTWGFFKKFRPTAAGRYRILAVTEASPSLPFVTSVRTTEADAVIVTETLYDIMKDPQTAHIREVLEFTGLSVPDVPAYEHLAEYEREAAELGYPELK
jgi:ABC-type phosphate/phosphonate transport system substrate-binding protein